MKRPKAKPTDPRVMFDADVAAFFGIDPNDAHPQTIGGRRL